jgi:hypothetical protein
MGTTITVLSLVSLYLSVIDIYRGVVDMKTIVAIVIHVNSRVPSSIHSTIQSPVTLPVNPHCTGIPTWDGYLLLGLLYRGGGYHGVWGSMGEGLGCNPYWYYGIHGVSYQPLRSILH